jgi:cation diffusion facilitator family transporter
VSPQRRTALVSVAAAAALIALKLGTGLATHSLGLLSEAAHSGTDLVAALLTFFAVGVAARPADVGHQYGHGKAEHLSALAEASVLVLASLVIVYESIRRLAGSVHTHVDARWWALLVIGVVIVIDISRAVVSWRASRKYKSAALASNALHFASDLGGSAAVLVGLLLVRAGYGKADSVAALVVACIVMSAAARLMRGNIDVLMDRVPTDAEAAARSAIAGVEPAVELRRLRMRQAAGRVFADVVIGVSVDAAVAQRAHAAALGVPRVREVHNVSVVALASGTELSLHLKLPGELDLDRAHAIAEQVEHAILEAVPELTAVQTHLEPLSEEGEAAEVSGDRTVVERVVRAETGAPPDELRFLHTDEGLVAHLTLALDSETALADAHAVASRIEETLRRELPEIADVIVHTEPRP